jgi:hypothetical protein
MYLIVSQPSIKLIQDLRNMADVVTDCVKQASGDICLLEHLCSFASRSGFPKDFAEGGSDSGGLETDFVGVCPVDVTDQHIDSGIISSFREGEHF